MHFVTTQYPKTQQREQQTQDPKRLTTKSTTSSLLTRDGKSSNSAGLNLSKPSAAHNIFENSQQHLQVQKSRQQQQKLLATTNKLNPMIKDIDISATATTTNPKAGICDSQDNEEEKNEICSHERRDSVPEDSPSTNKVQNIQESIIERHKGHNSSGSGPVFATATLTTSQPLVTGLCLKSQRCEVHSSAAASSTTSSPNNSPSPARTSRFTSVVEDAQTQLGGCAELNYADTVFKAPNNSKGRLANIAATPAASKISLNSQHSNSSIGGARDEDSQFKLGESTATYGEAFVRGVNVPDGSSSTSGQAILAVSAAAANEKPLKGTTRLSERAKKKSWYNVIYPNYKSRAEDFKKLFKDVPNDERLIVDYSCALQRDILVQGRLYVSQNYVCFHANIFSWETYVSIKWKEVTAITKEKTALVIPNAISISTAVEKYFFATFTSRDKSFLMLFRVWQNTLLNKQFSPQEIWQYVHNCYGEELGLTTDDEDYIDPTIDTKACDTETDVDFTTAIDDTASGGTLTTSDYNTANTNSSQSLNQHLQTSGNSSASSGGGGGARKSKTRSYFFKSNSSANASASGSDNNSRKPNKKMKSNAKELTLSSVKPEEQSVAVTMNSSSAPGGSTAAASGSGNNIKSSTTPAFPNQPVTIPSHDTKRKISKNNRQREEAVSKNVAETAPTDVSDSSDSEATNIPFVATTECTSPHEGRQILHTILPINIESLFSMLFLKSKFLTDFHAMRKSTDLMLGDWEANSESEKTRIVNVTVQLAASVGPKTSKVTEYQTMRDCSKAGELYSIDINSVNAGIPYADSFSVLLHYCLARTVDDHTMLSVHAQIKYKKSIWGVVKGFIEKNTWAGLEDFFQALLHALQSETCIPPAKGKGRRPRRGNATQLCGIDDSAIGIAQLTSEAAESTPLAKRSTISTSQAHVGVEQFSPQKHQQLLAQSAAQKHNKYKGLSILVVFLMCCLLMLNVVLLLKLWKLEEHIDVGLSRRARLPTIAALKSKPNSNEDWLELLRQQELLHETELRKWHQVLQTAIELLKKTEKTLAQLLFR